MKKITRMTWMCIALVMLIGSTALLTASAAAPVTNEARKVSYGSSSTTAQLIWADLSTPGVKVEPVVANGKLLTTASLSAIAERVRTPRTEVLAAVNGAFFDPAGTGYGGSNVFFGILELNGEYIKTGGGTIVMGFNAENKVKMGQPNPRIRMSREGDAERYRMPLDIWSINHTFNNSDEKVIYTTYYGATTPAESKTSIVVRNGVVTQVVNGPGPIYSDGFTLATRTTMTTYEVGDKVEYYITYADEEWADYPTKIAGGQIIVENSKIRTDYAEQGANDVKILQNSAPRSFIGVTADNKLFIGTVPGATVAQLAEIALNLGAVNAMNLDGGASSSLYLNGNYITPPGRDLVVAVAITYATPAAEPPAPVPHVPDTAAGWALPEIALATEKGLVLDEMVGYWTQPTNRLLAAEAIVRLIEVSVGKSIDVIAAEKGYDMGDKFADTDSKAVTFLKAAGISNGVGNNRYDPGGTYTRAAMMAMLGRMAENVFGIDAGAAPLGSLTFSDIPSWEGADKYIGWAVEAEITGGVGGGRFDSNAQLQNQHTAVFAYRAYRYFTGA